jgi:hypothetical protein
MPCEYMVTERSGAENSSILRMDGGTWRPMVFWYVTRSKRHTVAFESLQMIPVLCSTSPLPLDSHINRTGRAEGVQRLLAPNAVMTPVACVHLIDDSSPYQRLIRRADHVDERLRHP